MPETILHTYDPKTLDDFSHDENLIRFIKSMIQIKKLNLLLVGNNCVGKSKLVNAIVNDYYINDSLNIRNKHVMYINNLSESNTNNYKNEINVFCQTNSLIKKTLVVDDIDLISPQLQNVLKTEIDSRKNSVQFIGTCTNLSNVSNNIKSRVDVVFINIIHPDKIHGILQKICVAEQIEITSEARDYVIAVSDSKLNVMMNYVEKIKLMGVNVGINDVMYICSNLSLLNFDTFIDICKNKRDLLKGFEIINYIHSNGYSVLDVLDFLLTHIKLNNTLSETEKYEIIKCICKYTTIFHTIHEDKIELYLLTNDIIKIFDNNNKNNTNGAMCPNQV